ncbi:MAG TPA: molybdopterin biosynthesis protein [Stellaceae bacterium]|jgi:putative molybdopterin biosynthesis protein|nr:molybdopterin biosynthesis protein [Stellaceae bacterium]
MDDIATALRSLARQEQFLDVLDRDAAAARFQRHLRLRPLGSENVKLSMALGRVLARTITADVDVPGFDRASVDGFAVRADDTVGASERAPKALTLNGEILTPGTVPRLVVTPGTATLIATGGMVPRGADAVVMVEHTETRDYADATVGTTMGATVIEVRRGVAAGQFIAFAGSDLARGETVLRAGAVLTSREIGMLAAVGCGTVDVWRRPRVAIISTGDEIVAPGEPIRPGAVFDSNAAILAAAVEEAGGSAQPLGIGPDDESVLSRLVAEGLATCDLVLLSGGTSKGAGDLCYRAVAAFNDPGIVVHGVALKPGKPLCLAVTGGKPIVILPGFPTSAIFTFHEFVAPVIRAFAGLPAEQAERLPATLPMRIASERGRTEYLMVSLVHSDDAGKLAAYPNSKGSGAVTAFSQADGFITIGQHVESVAAGTPVEVQLIGRAHLADLVIIGSHCVGLDVLIDLLQAEGVSVKALNVGSTGGLAAAKRGECDIAAMHLMDPETGEYNRPFLTPALELIQGYRRLQGIVYRKDDSRFTGCSLDAALAAALGASDCLMVNRNAGSGTRILTDRLLAGVKPPGYWSQPKSHNAVAVAVAQKRADWGIAIESVARQYGLGFIPAQDEHYDFVLPRSRLDRPAVQRFRALLDQRATREALIALGFTI